jgi:hypothetical protein
MEERVSGFLCRPAPVEGSGQKRRNGNLPLLLLAYAMGDKSATANHKRNHDLISIKFMVW